MGRGGALVESMTFNRRVVGSTTAPGGRGVPDFWAPAIWAPADRMLMEAG